MANANWVLMLKIHFNFEINPEKAQYYLLQNISQFIIFLKNLEGIYQRYFKVFEQFQQVVINFRMMLFKGLHIKHLLNFYPTL